MPRVLLTERSQQRHHFKPPERDRQIDAQPPDRRHACAAEHPFGFLQIDRNWYQRYWWDEGPGSVQPPLMRALVGIAGKRILRMFRPMRNGTSASVHAGVPSSRGDTDR